VRLSDFIIASVILIAWMVYYNQPFTRSLLLAPLLILHLTLLALGLGFWLSALNVRYRDIGTALPVLCQLWLVCLADYYPSSLVPQQWKWAYELNPLTGIVEGFRASLLGPLISTGAVSLSRPPSLSHYSFYFHVFLQTFGG